MGVTARALVARRGRFVLNVAACDATSSGIAVLGPNGAGKTTLLLALQGLIPSDGQLARPTRCAAVFARPAVLRGTALWNISAIMRSVLGTSVSESEQRAHRALEGVGLTDVSAAEARTLSTGQRQRLALARALACEPQALFLDEAFANIDADMRPELRALVASYCLSSGCDLVVATSSLADATMCRDALVLEAGNVGYRGPVQNLVTSGDRYARALITEAAAL